MRRPPAPLEVLVIHPGALGDVLQAVPALAALRAMPGGARLSLAAQPRIGRLLLGAGVVDAALAFDNLGLEHLFADGAGPPCSRLGAFHRVLSWFGARAQGYAERLRALVPVALVAPATPAAPGEQRVWQHLVATLAPWGVAVDLPPRPLALPAGWRDEADAVLAGLGIAPGRPLLTVHPGAGGAAKRWPVGKLSVVVRGAMQATGCQILIHQGPADAEATRELLALLPDGPRAGKTLVDPPLGLLAAVLSRSTAYLGADSGVSHLAAAVGARAAILFTPGAYPRWSPWSPSARPIPMTADGADGDRALAALTGWLTAPGRFPDGRGPCPPARSGSSLDSPGGDA